MAQSLKELKEENAEAEKEVLAPPQEVDAEIEEEAAEEETNELDEAAELVEGEEEETTVEDWMQSEEQTSQDADIPNSAWKAAREQYKAKLQKKEDVHNTELSDLRSEIEKLKGGRQPAAPTNAKPTREQFYDASDQDEAYMDAMVDWKMGNAQATQRNDSAKDEVTRQQADFKKGIDSAVDQHYERAVGLAEKSGISAELYKSADLRVRQMFESVFPNEGDAAANTLIANLGEGSEKVMYSLGVNSSRLATLRSRLMDDPSGMKAMAYAGGLMSEISAPQKRKTTAPKPAANLKGDEQVSDKFKAAKKKYDAAHKRGDTSAAFTLKMGAKKAGVDTKTW